MLYRVLHLHDDEEVLLPWCVIERDHEDMVRIIAQCPSEQLATQIMYMFIREHSREIQSEEESTAFLTDSGQRKAVPHAAR